MAGRPSQLSRYVDGTIATEAAALHDDIDVPKLPAFPPEVLAAAGLLQSDVNTIREVLAAYDRTNAMAIIALSALLRRLDDEPLPAKAAQSSGGHKSHELPSEIPRRRCGHGRPIARHR